MIQVPQCARSPVAPTGAGRSGPSAIGASSHLLAIQSFAQASGPP